MPQATEEQRRIWGDPRDSISEGRAIRYLEERGYKLLEGFVWKKPNPEHRPTAGELGAICFLVDEWDFGGIVE